MTDSPNGSTTNGVHSNGDGASLIANRMEEIDARTSRTFNEQVEILTLNFLEQRNRLMNRFLDPRRDIYAECGHPRGYVPIEIYQELFERDPIGARVVELFPKECFQVSPDIYEDENPDTDTRWEKRLNQVCAKLMSCHSGTSSYTKDDKKSKLIDLVKRADIHSRIGSYGVMVIGINDNVDLSQPAEMRPPEEEDDLEDDEGTTEDTIELDESGEVEVTKKLPVALKRSKTIKGEKDTTVENAKYLTFIPSLAQQIPNPFSTSVADTRPFIENPYSSQGPYNPNGKDPSLGNTLPLSPRKGKGKGRNPQDYWLDLNFIQVFSEYYCKVSEWDNDERSPRFGQPVRYQITFNDTRQQENTGSSQPIVTKDVHWTRVVHLAEDANSIRAFPVMQQVLNRLLDLQKVYGPDAESFYTNGIPGWAFQTHPELGDVRLNKAGLKNEWENFRNSVLGKLVTSQGGEFKALTTSMVDPNSHILIHIQAICMKLGCPQRIFMGSERGELASSQDDAAWNDRVRERQNNYIKPCIIERLIDRLIALGVLPVPEAEEGYKVHWPDLESQGQSEKSTIAGAKTTALATFFDPTKEIFTRMAPMDFWTKIMGYDELEAEQIIENAEAEKEKVAKEKEEQQQKDLEFQDQQARQGQDRDLEFQQKQMEMVPPEQVAAGAPSAENPEAALGITGNEDSTNNIFCKTGSGGGVDPSCGGMSGSNTSGSGQFAERNKGIQQRSEQLQADYGISKGAVHQDQVVVEGQSLNNSLRNSKTSQVIQQGVEKVLTLHGDKGLKGSERKEQLKTVFSKLERDISSTISSKISSNDISDHPLIDKIAPRLAKLPNKMAAEIVQSIKSSYQNDAKGMLGDRSDIGSLREFLTPKVATLIHAYENALGDTGLLKSGGKVRHDVLDVVDRAVLGNARSKELRYAHTDEPAFYVGVSQRPKAVDDIWNTPLSPVGLVGNTEVEDLDEILYLSERQLLNNIFCKTGPGGGIKPDCFAHSDVDGGGPTSSTPTKQLATEKEIYAMKPKALKALAAEIGYEVYQKSSGALKARLVSILDSGRLVKDGMKNRDATTSPTPTTPPKTTQDTPNPAKATTSQPAKIIPQEKLGEAVIGAFKGLDRGANQVSLADLAKQTGIPLKDLHSAVNDLRKKGVLTVSQTEKYDKTVHEAAIKEGDQYLGYVSIRNEELANNIYCPNGPGGGIDPGCKAGGVPGPNAKPGSGKKDKQESASTASGSKARGELKTDTEREEFEKKASDWGANLSDRQQHFLKMYQVNSDELNFPLRKGIIESQSQVDLIDSSIAGYSLPHDVKTYRGFGTYTQNMLNMAVGSEFIDKGYGSTSTNKQLGEGFGQKVDGKMVIAEIHLPKGSKAAVMNANPRVYEDYIHQNEVLLPRGTKYKVVGKTETDNTVTIQLETIGDGGF